MKQSTSPALQPELLLLAVVLVTTTWLSNAALHPGALVGTVSVERTRAIVIGLPAAPLAPTTKPFAYVPPASQTVSPG